MKKYFILAAMASLALVACKKDGIDTDDVNTGGNNNKVAELVFNEIDGNNKLIEIYNNSDKEQSLEGVYFVKYDSSKEGGKSTTWTGAKGMTIPAHGWVYIESSDLSDEVEGGDPNYKYQSDNHIFKGGLSPKKNMKLELCGPDDKVLDTFIRGEEGAGWNQVKGYAQNKDASFCRVPDGKGEWVYAAPTPGAANGAKTGDIEQTNE